jgi:ABC-type transport system involved in multi-copper enzyme maturation permease subunit
MSFRWGLGPVFYYEWMTTARRWQMYAVRSLFIAVLLAALTIVWWRELGGVPTWRGLDVYARVGTAFCTILLTTLFALVVLVAPTVSAGAVCQDKARGPLFHLFTTDLSDTEIIFGKLMARLIPLVGLIGCSVPVMFLSTLFGGVELRPLVGSFLVLLGIALLGCTLSLLISVVARRTYEVLLVAFSFWAVVLLSNAIIRTFDWFANLGSPSPAAVPVRWGRPPPEPDYSLLGLVLAPITSGNAIKGRLDSMDIAVWVFGIMAIVSAALLLVAILAVRRITVRQAGQAQRRRVPALSALFRWHGRSWLPRPPLDWNPVLWREWRRRRSTLVSTITWTVYVLLAGLLTVKAAFTKHQSIPWFALSDAEREFPCLVNAALVAIGLLMLSVTSVTSLVEERDRGSLDVLLTTPLPSWHIIAAKWLVSYRQVLPLAFFPSLLAYLLAPARDPWPDVLRMLGLVLAYGAVITSLGLALATWIKQPSRALTISVTIYVLVSIGWVPVALLSDRLGFAGSFLALASPFYMVRELTNSVLYQRGELAVWDAWASVWTAAYPWLAACLFLLTLRTFDACLGRLRENRKALPERAIPLEGGWG